MKKTTINHKSLLALMVLSAMYVGCSKSQDNSIGIAGGGSNQSSNQDQGTDNIPNCDQMTAGMDGFANSKSYFNSGASVILEDLKSNLGGRCYYSEKRYAGKKQSAYLAFYEEKKIDQEVKNKMAFLTRDSSKYDSEDSEDMSYYENVNQSSYRSKSVKEDMLLRGYEYNVNDHSSAKDAFIVRDKQDFTELMLRKCKNSSGDVIISAKVRDQINAVLEQKYLEDHELERENTLRDTDGEVDIGPKDFYDTTDPAGYCQFTVKY